MRLLLVVLIALVGLVQYPLWLGKGGWFRVWSLQSQVAEQREVNEGLRARNAALAAEVQDLLTGTGALEERARADLGMMRESEVFVQILPHDVKPPPGARSNGDAAGISPAAAAPTRSGATPARATTAPANTAAPRSAAAPLTAPARTPANQRSTGPAVATPIPAPASAPR